MALQLQARLHVIKSSVLPYSKVKLPDCNADMLCNCSISYGDGSITDGYYVKGNIQLDSHWKPSNYLDK
ncbi:hypothetical protein FF2_033813 [Malus domestica]